MTWPPCPRASVRDLLGVSRTSAPARASPPKADSALSDAGIATARVPPADTMREMDRPHPLFTRTPEPACDRCGFSLRGLRGNGQCPECGEAYDKHAPATTSPTFARAVAYVLLPIACGITVGATTMLIVRGQVIFDRVEYFLFAFVFCAGPTVFPAALWSSWRGIHTIHAFQSNQPRTQRERPLSVALGCAGTGIAGVTAVLAVGGLAVLAAFLLLPRRNA